MEMNIFTISPTPTFVFGAGALQKLPSYILKYGTTALFIIGQKALKENGTLDTLNSICKSFNITSMFHCISCEPSVQLIDEAVEIFKDKNISCVVSCGGGSVIDAGKAISAMLTVTGSVKDYLEGVGTKKHCGSKIPFIAIPTTAGTGSEATKNAVISEVGENGFKKSLRHDNFMPNVAIVDPELSLSLPKDITAHCGFDAISQLLESFISTRANFFTDSICENALLIALKTFVPLYNNPIDINLRTAFSYAAYISGLTLANAGLGICHGIAGPMGGLHKINHGIVCANILPASITFTVNKILQNVEENFVAFSKIAKIGRHLHPTKDVEPREYCIFLAETLEAWADYVEVPRFRNFGLKIDDCKKIASVSDIKNSPVDATKEDLELIIKNRI